MNPNLSNNAVYWLSQLKSLQRLHFYFLPYVTKQTAMLRQLRLSLPNCKVTFPETNIIGYGYDEADKY